jgi:sulfopyruvate decarboxylase TPP-binding subunit
MMDVQSIATGLDAGTVLEAIKGAGTTHVVTVPDTHQRTVMAALDDTEIPVLRAATEEQVLGICAGLWMSGHQPLALIQQLGLFASVNALRAFTHDQRIPLPILAGLYGRDVTRSVEDNVGSAIRLCIPLLHSLGIRTVLVDGAHDEHLIRPGLSAAYDEGITSAVLLGAPTI